MENLDLLSDDQLRVRLQQYGFANLPVTDTTRKVLVKKLRIAIEGQSTKTRRDTVAVAKFSSDEEQDKEQNARGSKKEKTTNRRATIAAAASEKVKVPVVLSFNGGLNNVAVDSPGKTSRRSSRATPSKDKPTVPTTTFITTTLEEDTDEDIIEVPVTTRRSRTPSLGKSETVRTSYKTTNDLERSFVEENHIFDDEEDDEDEQIIAPVVTKTTVRRKTYTSSASTLPPLKVQEKSTPSKFGRASLTTSYNPRGNYKDKEDEEPLEINETNTPYLSNFAKRLSHLRAEPLDSGLDKYKELQDEAPTTKTYKATYQQQPTYQYKEYKSAPALRPTIRKQGASKDLAQFFDTLDRQYNFRTILYIIIIVMIVVAIYVALM